MMQLILKSKKVKNYLVQKQIDDITAWLDLMCIKQYIINDDVSVDVNDDVYIAGKCLTHIPVQFRFVKGKIVV